MLPSDLDGQPPPAGSPNYFAEVDSQANTPSLGADAMRIWKFHVDWSNTANSTFGVNGEPNSTLPVAMWNPAQCVEGQGTCVPQLGSPYQLDVIGDRIMFRLAYRNFGDHEALVVNHSVLADARIGVRWYEVRSPGSSPVIYQQGTFAPTDTLYRWMGSAAQDHNGNMAIGYSTSSASTYPSIAYAGRLAGDPLNQLSQGETQMFAGLGPENVAFYVPPVGRWGDYTDLTVDPTDDCTFWYVNEYMPTQTVPNPGAPWRTRIGSFKFPSCTNAAPAYHAPYDFDGDGKSDVSIFRGDQGLWAAIPSSNPSGPLVQQNWGSSALGDVIAPADYDGDGKADYAVFRPSAGTFYIHKNSGGDLSIPWGLSGDIPVPADYDGDGKADVAVFRPSDGTFYVLRSTNNSLQAQQWGANGDKPVIGDFNGDGKADFAVARADAGALTFYVLYNGTTSFVAQQWGLASDIVIPGDFDGDKKADLAVFRPSDGNWYVFKSSGGFSSTQWGLSGDVPVAADYDGDQRTDVAVFRPSDGNWYILGSTAGYSSTAFGLASDTQVPAAYNR
jgi:hypothetical protein